MSEIHEMYDFWKKQTKEEKKEWFVFCLIFFGFGVVVGVIINLPK